MFRYMAIAWNAADTHQGTTCDLICRRMQTALPDMRSVCHTEGLRVFVTGVRPGSTEPYPLSNGEGVVLGKLFRQADSQHGAPRAIELDESETSSVLRSAGRHLVRHYWGRYVALARNRSTGTTWVLRDPCGGLPCFVTTFDGVTILFSWMEDCSALRLQQFSIDWTYVSALATEFPLHGRATGLHGISEVQMGECTVLHADSSQSRSLYWNPVELVQGETIDDFDEAVDRARRTVQGCIGAWASAYPRIVCLLSGGLDSSIVLSCLAGAPSRPDVRCVNYYDTSDAGDERGYARLAAGRAQLDLTELQFDPAAVPAEVILKFARMAYPTPWPEAFYTHVRVSELARQWSASAIFDGNFGDSLFFYYSDQTLRVADYMHAHGFWGRDLLRIAVMAAAQERRWLGSVLMSGVRKGLLRPRCRPTEHLGRNRWFVTPEAMKAASGYPDFLPPYLADRPRIAPGKGEQIVGLAFPPSFYGPISRPGDPDKVSVLTSQPLRELFFRIPTYVLTAGPDSRAVAKRAFAQDIPPEIIARYIKGVVNDFLARYLQHNERFAREMLLDGLLVRNRILDRPRLEEFFAARKYSNVARATEIVLYHLAVEAWAQSWTGTSQVRAAA